MPIIGHMHRALLATSLALVGKPGPLAIQPLSIVHNSLPHLVAGSRADSLKVVVRLHRRFSISSLLKVPLILLTKGLAFFDCQRIIKALLVSVLLDSLLILFVMH